MQPELVRERLESLNTIDSRLCAMIDGAASVVSTFSELKRGEGEQESLKTNFQKNVDNFYVGLREIHRQLSLELQILDDNVGTTLLPIVVKKKAIGQDDDKLREQLQLLKELLNDKNPLEQQDDHKSPLEDDKPMF